MHGFFLTLDGIDILCLDHANFGAQKRIYKFPERLLMDFK